MYVYAPKAVQIYDAEAAQCCCIGLPLKCVLAGPSYGERHRLPVGWGKAVKCYVVDRCADHCVFKAVVSSVRVNTVYCVMRCDLSPADCG